MYVLLDTINIPHKQYIIALSYVFKRGARYLVPEILAHNMIHLKENIVFNKYANFQNNRLEKGTLTSV